MTILISVIALCILFWILIRPSNNRIWEPDQAILPYAEIHGNRFSIKNIRNFFYISEFEYEPNYYDADFDLKGLKRVDYILVPFASWEGPAHTFLSFSFEDGRHIAISIEIRKKLGQKFSALKGLFKSFEIMYVIADEQDVIRLRTHHRKNPVYIYPLKLEKEQIKNLFVDMLMRTNKLYKKPEFYNSVFNSCSTNIAVHLNRIYKKYTLLPWSYKMILPGYSDKLLHKLGLLDTEHPYEKIRLVYYVSNKAIKYSGSDKFSEDIRSINHESFS